MMMNLDPNVLMSMLDDERRGRENAELLLAQVRESAIRWEHEAKALRKEVQRLRMQCDTERLHKP